MFFSGSLSFFLSPESRATLPSKITPLRLHELYDTLSAVVDRVLVADFNSELAPQVNMVNLPLLKICAQKVRSPMSLLRGRVAFTNKIGTFQLARSDTNFI